MKSGIDPLEPSTLFFDIGSGLGPHALPMSQAGCLEYMKKTALDTVPVILISSNVDDNNIQKAYEYDVVDYIQKPFQEDVVRQRVQRVVDLYQNKREKDAYEQAE